MSDRDILDIPVSLIGQKVEVATKFFTQQGFISESGKLEEIFPTSILLRKAGGTHVLIAKSDIHKIQSEASNLFV